MMTLTSDIRLSFEAIGVRFQSILNEKYGELEEVINNVVDNFDFEKVLTAHVNNLIEEGIEKAAENVDLSGALKDILFKEIDNRLSKVE